MSAVLDQKPDYAQLWGERPRVGSAVYIPPNLLAPSKTNPRKHFDAAKMAELVESVKKHGILQPILARGIDGAINGRPQYEIVAGERRWRAAVTAKLAAIPTIVKPMTDFEVLELQLIENMQRDDLTPMEEANGYRALMRKPNEQQGFATAEELGARIGKSKGYVYARMKLCDLVAEGRKALEDGKLSASTALLIARLPAHQQPAATKLIVQGWGGEPATFRDAKEAIERDFMLTLGSALFKITDETLLAGVGSCKACPKRTGSDPDLFGDVKNADVCTDPPCFQKKKEAHQLRLVEIAKEEGREVIAGAAAKKLQPYAHGEIKDYVKLDDAAYRLGNIQGGGYEKTIGQVLGKTKPAITLFEDPHTKELVEVVKRDDVVKLLKEKGVIRAPQKTQRSDAEVKREAKAKAENAWRMAVAQQAIAAVVDPQFDAVGVSGWLIPETACAMWCRLETEVEKRAEKLLGWEHIDVGYNGDGPGVKKLEERVGNLTSAQLDQMLVAMAIAGQTHVSTYHTPTAPTRLLRVAIGLGINVDQVKRELAGAAKAKAKKAPAKKAPAKKPVAKKGAKS